MPVSSAATGVTAQPRFGEGLEKNVDRGTLVLDFGAGMKHDAVVVVRAVHFHMAAAGGDQGHAGTHDVALFRLAHFQRAIFVEPRREARGKRRGNVLYHDDAG